MNIAICDDSEYDALAAREVIKQTLKELHINAEITYYLNAEEIDDKLLNYKEQLDILILDIDMPRISGLELAQKLRANQLDLIIIFLSNHEEFVFKAIEFQPFRYIRKIRLKTEMPLAIRAAARLVQIQMDKQVILDSNDGEIKVMISEIMYFEADKRKTIVHLSNGKIRTINRNLTEFYEALKSSKFVMIHRSCVVNADYVQNIKNDIAILKNDEKLVISRRKAKEVKQRIIDEWGELI
ncbi:MAG: response regulator transcription factor [Ruminococcus sp.]|nr:response regulator transcription factor [Ruminococcus sp.]